MSGDGDTMETTVDSVLRFLEGREAVPERVLA